MNVFVVKEISETPRYHIHLLYFGCRTHYHQQIQQPQYQQLKVERHLRVYGNGEFLIFSLLQMRSQDTNLRQNYETRFQQKLATKLNKL